MTSCHVFSFSSETPTLIWAVVRVVIMLFKEGVFFFFFSVQFFTYRILIAGGFKEIANSVCKLVCLVFIIGKVASIKIYPRD